MLTELASGVRERRVSAAELVTRSLERIQKLDPSLNAVVAIRGEEALADATELDARVARGEEAGALAGLPLLVKDNQDVTGMRTTYGSRTHADAPPAGGDSLVVERLRAAGAIVVGKTNIPEFTFEGYSANPLFGVTGNPWASAWSPGGSSGGSGAALAAGMAAIATATDGGGSVRIPAGFCGLAGLKPTGGVIGRWPPPSWMDLSTPGPLASTVDDVRLLLEAMAGPVSGDPSALPRWEPPADGSTFPARVLAAPRTVPWGPLPSSIEALFRQALTSFERDLGIAVEPIESDSIFRAGNLDDDWLTMCAAEQAHKLGREWLETNAGLLDTVFREAMELGLRVSIEDYLAVRRRRFEYVREMDELLGDDGMLVTPTMTEEGWSAEGVKPGAEHPGTDGQAYNTQAANMTGHPALSVPAGRSPNGVPFGIQLTGPRFRDDLVLAIGEAWERANPWPLVADGYEPFDLP